MNGRDYDVGLHAVTNFTAKGAKKGPLARILRQLRFKWEDFALAPGLFFQKPNSDSITTSNYSAQKSTKRSPNTWTNSMP